MNPATPQDNPATPQDTYDHTFGAGCLEHEWWISVRQTVGSMSDIDQPGNWEVSVTADDGEGTEANKLVNHNVVMQAALAILFAKDTDLNGSGRFVSKTLREECRNLLYNAENADFDAITSDELLQVAVLGEIIFG